MPYIDFKKLKSRVTLAEVLDHYGLLEGLAATDAGYEGTCPFCGSNAFKVNTSKNAWFCFGECKRAADDEMKSGGNMLDFVMRRDGVDIKTAATRIVEWFPEQRAHDAPHASTAPTKQVTAKAKQRERSDNARNTKQPAEPKPKPRTDEEDGQSAQPTTPDVGQGADAAEAAAPPMDHGEHLLTQRNKPLEFTLKSVDGEHDALDALQLTRETLRDFDVGYFTGKGMMHNKVVIPFHNKDGLLVAYVGYSLKDGTCTYPDRKHFDPRLELFNTFRAEHAGMYMDTIVLVSELWNVLRLHECGVRRVLALPTERLFAPQIEHIRRLVGDGGRVHYVPWTREYDANLRLLAEHFHVRLHRYYDGSEDEFLATVAAHFFDW